MHDDSHHGNSRADRSCTGQTGRATITSARRALTAALWLTTLFAVYLTVCRSGAYGLVAEAQDLVALYGVLRAAVYAMEAALGHRAARHRRPRSAGPGARRASSPGPARWRRGCSVKVEPAGLSHRSVPAHGTTRQAR
jgi:hypothetical protein